MTLLSLSRQDCSPERCSLSGIHVISRTLLNSGYLSYGYYDFSGTIHGGMDHSLVKKIPCRLAYSPILWKHFLN